MVGNLKHNQETKGKDFNKREKGKFWLAPMCLKVLAHEFLNSPIHGI